VITQGNTIVRWFALGMLATATAAMFVISMRGNFLYGYGIGLSLD
jgi:hypothetical protein